jgi:hypothetical protein
MPLTLRERKSPKSSLKPSHAMASVLGGGVPERRALLLYS